MTSRTDLRFWSKVKIGRSTDCWPWTGEPTADGYGRFRVSKTPSVRALAHRWVAGLRYPEHAGDGIYIWPHLRIPSDLVVDHLCRNRLCCNPNHLDLVTIAENTARGEHPLAVAGRTDTCPKGHSLADAYIRGNGRRLCRTCNNARNAAR